MVAMSFAGVDARAAVSMFDGAEYINSLTTVCSPHLGMKLIDEMNKDPEYELFDNLERVFDILGVNVGAAKEFSTHNINNFNEICEDAPNV
jgi:triacylglycerol lipase